MASLYIIIVLVTALDSAFSYTLDGASKSVKWPTAYHLRGEETDVNAGIIKPFEAWYNAGINKSRIDYYGGTVKHYYVAESDEDYGRDYYVHPVTTEEVMNEIICEETKLTDAITNFLPPIKDYKYQGKLTYNNKEIDVWKYFETDEGKSKLEKVLYVYRTEEGIDIPVLREIKSHNLWLGTVDTHTVTRFYDYSIPKDDDLDHKLEGACNDTLVSATEQKEISNIMPLHISSDVEEAFASYIILHNKQYGSDEHEIRKKIFQENWKRVIQHNQQNLGYTLTLNKFSDRTEEELAYLTATRQSENRVGSEPFPHTEEEVNQLVEDVPESYDMRVEGFISSIKNQANCGSCWAFSTTAAVEGVLARNNGGRNIDLAEQSMVDCAWGFGNLGCNGGTVEAAYKYILKYGLPTHMQYGLYLDEVGRCNLKNVTEFYNIRGFAAVPPLSVNAMKVALYKYGPVTVGVNANAALKLYHSGIFFDPTCNDDPANHAVTVVGYGVREGVTYWIIKNSWGEDWGEDGYFLLSATNNNCHLLETCFYPIA